MTAHAGHTEYSGYPCRPYSFLLLGRVVLLITVPAAVDLVLLIRQVEDLVKPLLDRGDTSRILAVDDIDQLFGKLQLLLLDDLAIFDDVDGDGMVDEAKRVKIQHLKRSFHFDDIFFAHLLRMGMHDHSDLAVQTVKLETLVDIHGLAGRDVVQNNTFV